MLYPYVSQKQKWEKHKAVNSFEKKNELEKSRFVKNKIIKT